jgi:hypothetical protein
MSLLRALRYLFCPKCLNTGHMCRSCCDYCSR